MKFQTFKNVFVNAMNTFNRNLALESAALTRVQSILCIRLVNVLSKQTKKKGLLLKPSLMTQDGPRFGKTGKTCAQPDKGLDLLLGVDLLSCDPKNLTLM